MALKIFSMNKIISVHALIKLFSIDFIKLIVMYKINSIVIF